jgi:2-dehydropantoate 2-reductase
VVHAGRGDLVIGEYGPRTAAPDGAPRSAPGAGSGGVQRPVAPAASAASGPGAADGTAASRCARIAATFERAGVACRVSPDVRAELWTKLVMNAAFNAISALARARYGAIVADPAVAATMRAVVDECVAVARADGVALQGAETLHAAALKLGAAMAGATSSTEQDLARGRATEIDALNGYVVARGDARGVPVPVNRALHALVRLLERERAAGEGATPPSPESPR